MMLQEICQFRLVKMNMVLKIWISMRRLMVLTCWLPAQQVLVSQKLLSPI